MIKNIKKSLKYLIIFIGIVFMVPTSLYLLLQNAEVQTFLVNRITSHFSAEIKSTITVGKLEYKFFNRIVISDLLIKDENLDTLFYTEKITAGLKRVDLHNKSFRLGRVIVMKPVLAFISDSTGTMNIQKYIGLAGKSADSTIKGKTSFAIDQIDISDARFSMSNLSKAGGKSKIDVNKLRITSINGIIEDLKVINDTTSFNIYNLAFRESSGFNVSRMSTSMHLANKSIILSSVNLNCDSSVINLSQLSIKPDSSGSFKNFIEDVRLDIIFDQSIIHSSDLQYFVPLEEGLNESLVISGRVYGTVSELRGRSIDLSFHNKTHLLCDFDFSGLPNIDNTFLYFGVSGLTTNAEDFENLNIPGKGKINIPDVLYNLGDISFTGSFTGFTTDFVTYGKFSTDQGIISTDISFRPEEVGRYKLKGLLTGSNIALGGLTGKTEFLGNLSMKTNIDGYATSLKSFAVDITGVVDSIEVNRYIYRNIDLNGLVTESTWDGSVKIVDDNLKMDLLGILSFKEEIPVFDFSLNIAEANLFNLNFDKSDSTSALAMQLTSNFKGNNIDNLDGEIKILNSNLKKHGNILEINNFSVKTFTENNQTVLSLRTDFLDADIWGYYNFAALGNLFKETLSTLMPSQFINEQADAEQLKNNFDFEMNFKNTDKINNFFKSGVLLADKSYIKGKVYSDSLIAIEGKAKYLNLRNNIFNDFALEALVKGEDLTVDINSSSLTLLGQTEQKGFSIDLKTKPDNFIFSIEWDNKDQNMNRGNFIARGNISKSLSDDESPILTIDIDSTEIYSQKEIWKIGRSSIKIDTTSININKLYISNKDHYYMVNGKVSEDPSDTLHLDFNGIDISPLNLIVNQKKGDDPTMISMDFKGLIYGKILLNNVYKNLLLESNINISDFSLLGSKFGTFSVVSTLDLEKKIININASNNLNGQRNISVSGFYDPDLKKVELTTQADKLPIDALNRLLTIFASEISGSASGKVKMSGVPGNFILEGSLLAENTSMKIDYLQTKFKLNDSIRFDKKGINFNNIKLSDERENFAILSGTVFHNNFRDYKADLIINIPSPNECQVLNTKAKDNELFYGNAFASGFTTIKSGPNTISFDISAKTGNNTKFFIPLNSGLSVSEYSFITFIDSSRLKSDKPKSEDLLLIPSAPKQTGMDINFDLEVTPDAEVQLIFDSKVGDVMKGHGSGNLNINLTQKGDFRISGDYIIDDGDYLFTLGNLFNKSFSVENGGKILFNGDLDNAEIDIKAIYKLKASLDPLFPEEGYTERMPVECQLNLSGKLFNPTVNFNIYLPTADEKTRTNVRNFISTDEELSRQFLYLLVMNSFYYESSPTSTGTSAMAVTTTEMLSNQLSNWLSQISNDFDIGFNYRPGTKDLNSQEVEFALSTQVFDDKVVLNSNFDVRGTSNNTSNTNQITGDFDAEIKITEKVKFKVFNRFNNPYTGKLAPYTQGIGIFFKEDFDKFSDLFKKKVTADPKKEEEIKAEEAK